ncbi:Bifunctional DNA primase/polymerase, N-terminal [Pseudonocardia oroxyli]|uniref:Bifunctional DNA primase/polymerase, N-terminal n=2 Tax=Pseudonocardia oroxyli TaxID=366584 RepID=A0A1G7R273_PSEOR|nr:Bifunctional DNA primase/polymerase, N-terminal [Pseudonocardia oroxyli]
MPGTDLLRAALAHTRRGWHVFPLRPSDKRPAIRDWETRATTDVVRIRKAWSREPFGIGIACGPSGLVVLDLDRPKPDSVRPPEWDRPGITDGVDVLAALAGDHGAEVPLATFSVLTGSGGAHLYLTAPAGVGIKNSAESLMFARPHCGHIATTDEVDAGQRSAT